MKDHSSNIYRNAILILFALFINTAFIHSQIYNFGLSIRGNYTTTSRLYPSPTPNSYEDYYPIDGIWGFGAEIRSHLFLDRILLGISGEFVSGEIRNQDKSTRLEVKDGYGLYIFELNGYYIIPLSTERFKIYLGGGLNFSFGKRIREILAYSAENIRSPINVGIQVLSGLEFFIFKNFSARWEMKFRDPLIETESKFKTDRFIYKNTTYTLPTEPFKTRINIDGIVFDLALAYYF
jgi:opacity protein-like surface antigen